MSAKPGQVVFANIENAVGRTTTTLFSKKKKSGKQHTHGGWTCDRCGKGIHCKYPPKKHR